MPFQIVEKVTKSKVLKVSSYFPFEEFETQIVAKIMTMSQINSLIFNY